MNKAKELTKEQIKEVLKKWSIDAIPVSIHPRAWDINQSYILKAYDEPEVLERNLISMRTLLAAGVPVPVIISLPDGKDYAEKDGGYYMLMTKLHGHAVKPYECMDNWFFHFGTILAEFHIAFLKCENNLHSWDNSLLEEMNGWVKKNITKYNIDYLNEKDVQAAVEELASFYEDLPRQLIHRDVHLGNFLFENGEFTGYIDFDLSQKNIRIFDLCYFLLGLLLEENGFKEDDRWYEIIRLVVSGYDRVSPLNVTEKRAFASVMKNIELLFAAYFIDIGEAELARNAVDLFYFVKRNESKILTGCNTQT